MHYIEKCGHTFRAPTQKGKLNFVQFFFVGKTVVIHFVQIILSHTFRIYKYIKSTS